MQYTIRMCGFIGQIIDIMPRHAISWSDNVRRPSSIAMLWASQVYQIRNIAGCAYAGNAGNVYRHQLQRKPLFSDPGMHQGTCVTHVPWCMSGSRTRGGRENVPSIPGTCATCKFAYLVRGPLAVKTGCALVWLRWRVVLIFHTLQW